MPQQASTKGNPATKRMGNLALKARRAASWARAQKKHLERNAANNEAAKKNKKLRAENRLTPWELACESRKAKRNIDPNVQRRRQEFLLQQESESDN